MVAPNKTFDIDIICVEIPADLWIAKEIVIADWCWYATQSVLNNVVAECLIDQLGQGVAVQGNRCCRKQDATLNCVLIIYAIWVESAEGFVYKEALTLGSWARLKLSSWVCKEPYAGRLVSIVDLLVSDISMRTQPVSGVIDACRCS